MGLGTLQATKLQLLNTMENGKAHHPGLLKNQLPLAVTKRTAATTDGMNRESPSALGRCAFGWDVANGGLDVVWNPLLRNGKWGEHS